MSRRITLISNLEQSELKKIDKLITDIKFKTCKVPYGIDDEHRYDIDNLPYHFTIFATNKENQEEFIDLIKTVNIDKMKLKVNKVEIMNGKYDSYVLYLGIEDNQDLKQLQKLFYYKFPKEHYNPENFTFHMTLHIDKDYEIIKTLQNKMLEKFEPFYLEFDELVLYNYPGEKIQKFNLNNNCDRYVGE